MSTTIQPELTERLKSAGDPRETFNWGKGQIDYVGRFALTPEDVPSLIDLAVQWADPELPFEEIAFAPIHAWRALAQLEAVQAVDALIGILNELDRSADQWYLEEFPEVFALIGPAAAPELADFLADADNLPYARIAAAHALAKVALLHPETRDTSVASLTRLLEQHGENDASLNAFLVSYLLDLEARESAEIIEQAFAANRVDELVVGHWAMVREELGVSGLGIAPDGPIHKRPFAGLASSLPELIGRPPHQSSRTPNRAGRKRKRQNRKRNRKRR